MSAPASDTETPQAPEGAGPVVAAATRWRRLDARMLLIEPVQAVMRFIPALIGLLVVGTANERTPWWFGIPLVIFPIALAILSWFTTRYRITPEQLQLRRGLVQRNTLTAPLDRVRTVDVTASLLHRLLGVAAVKVGTGSDTPFVLDGLTAGDAQALRSELLHVSRGVESDTAPMGTPASAGEPETQVAQFSTSWLRYAPFSLSGVVAIIAAVGFAVQFLDDLGARALETALGESVRDHVATTPLWMSLVEGLVIGIVLLTVASVVSYALMYWGYALTRHSGGTLGVRRGLLTTRHTTLEERRLRGIIVEHPLLLRWVKAAKAKALVTGLASSDAEVASSSSDLLIPPAPRSEVERVVGIVLRDRTPIEGSLTEHGPAARRRRYGRAMLGSLMFTVPTLVALWWWAANLWLVVLAVLPVLLAPLMAWGRYRNLGHALTAEHLVASSGLFPTERAVLRRSGIIGWTIDSTFFQRRAGLVTLRATLAASRSDIAILDVPADRAVDVIRLATPGLLDPHLDARG